MLTLLDVLHVLQDCFHVLSLDIDCGNPLPRRINKKNAIGCACFYVI
jgi:hypothetical protein